MIEWVIAPLTTIVLAGIGFFMREQWSQISRCNNEIHELKQELMKRSEIILHVDKEISRLKVEIKEDQDKVIAYIQRLDSKIDNLIQHILEKKL